MQSGDNYKHAFAVSESLLGLLSIETFVLMIGMQARLSCEQNYFGFKHFGICVSVEDDANLLRLCFDLVIFSLFVCLVLLTS